MPFAIYLHILNSNSQNRDLKCNRICKLPVSSSCLDTFYDPYSSFLNYQLLHYLVFLVFLCRYGHIVKILGFCVSGSKQLLTGNAV